MTMRQSIFQALDGDVTLRDILTGDGRIYESGAVSSETRSPFLTVRWLEDSFPGTSGGGFRLMSVWGHHRSGSYVLIDQALQRVSELLDGYTEAGMVSLVEWVGNSPDLFDDGLNTNTRHADFRVLGGIKRGES